MGFWNTFVGKAIHAVSFGLVGPDSDGGSTPSPASGTSSGVMTDTQLKCIGDFDFYINNSQLCMQAGFDTPPGGGMIPPPISPGVPTTPVIGGNTPVTSTPVSSVPEPSSIAMLLCGVAVVAYFARKRLR